VLIIPKRHIPTVNDLGPDDDAVVGSMIRLAARLAKDRGVDESGYRTVFNCNSHAGQTVFHVHLHLLAGRRLGWPPG
jgi:histidine triad (HIT) family protein